MKEIILSAGIDIGTSTTQLVFSNIVVENMSYGARVPILKIVDRKIIYRGDIHYTPLVSNTRLDTEKIMRIIGGEYRKAGIKPESVNTGAVIITGDTARKENAEEVLNAISGFAGEFVVATAGADMEGIIAGKGSGACRYSDENFSTVVNLDIGGGTTNISLFKNGETLDTSCFDIGGRLVRFKKGTREVEYIYPRLKDYADKHGLRIDIGQEADSRVIEEIVDAMAQVILQSIGLMERDEKYYSFLTRGSEFKKEYSIDHVSFSGGVSDIIYGNVPEDRFEFNDIGVMLGLRIRDLMEGMDINLIESIETLGATVVGAGNQTTELSGSTISFSREDIFPIKNIPVLKVLEEDKEDAFVETARKKLDWILGQEEDLNVAIALNYEGRVTFEKVQRLAGLIIESMDKVLKEQELLIVVVTGDIGKVLGQTLMARLGYKKDVICLDSLKVEDGDYIDIGKPVGNGSAVPVVIKTLVFNY